MRPLATSWFVGAGHCLASGLVLGACWEQLGRRLGHYALPMVVAYAVLSIAMLVLAAMLSRKVSFNCRLLVTALVPYLSTSLAYIGALVTSGEFGLMANKLGIFNVLAVAAFFPYLAFWGPVVTAVNVTILLLSNRALDVG